MRYLVICKDKTAFYTDWYKENCWNEQLICVVNKTTHEVTFDGETWGEIEEDHL